MRSGALLCRVGIASERDIDGVRIFDTKQELGKAAAADAAEIINRAIRDRNVAYVIAATGASQLSFSTRWCVNRSIGRKSRFSISMSTPVYQSRILQVFVAI